MHFDLEIAYMQQKEAKSSCAQEGQFLEAQVELVRSVGVKSAYPFAFLLAAQSTESLDRMEQIINAYNPMDNDQNKKGLWDLKVRINYCWIPAVTGKSNGRLPVILDYQEKDEGKGGRLIITAYLTEGGAVEKKLGLTSS
jgi:hypothetical protein